MKKSLIALAAFGALTGLAHADSSVSIYGVVDAAVRASNNQNASGDKLNSVGGGLLQGSRLGFKGKENLGSGTSALFKLETGFNLNNGTSAQNGGTFSRVATVGLSNEAYGTVNLGRQNTLAYDTLIATDVYGVANNVSIAGYQSSLSGLRWDNSVKYTNNLNDFNYGVQYSSGNQIGSNSQNSGFGLNLGYSQPHWNVQAVYQLSHDTKDGVLGTLNGQKQDLWAVGGKYELNNRTDVYGQYVYSKFDQSNQANKIVTVGVAHDLGNSWSVKGAATYDKQENVGQGSRQTYSAVVDYAFSKRTDVYAGLDYNRLNGSYTNASYNLNNAGNPNTNSTGLSVGLRHTF